MTIIVLLKYIPGCRSHIYPEYIPRSTIIRHAWERCSWRRSIAACCGHVVAGRPLYNCAPSTWPWQAQLYAEQSALEQAQHVASVSCPWPAAHTKDSAVFSLECWTHLHTNSCKIYCAVQRRCTVWVALYTVSVRVVHDDAIVAEQAQRMQREAQECAAAINRALLGNGGELDRILNRGDGACSLCLPCSSRSTRATH